MLNQLDNAQFLLEELRTRPSRDSLTLGGGTIASTTATAVASTTTTAAATSATSATSPTSATRSSSSVLALRVANAG